MCGNHFYKAVGSLENVNAVITSSDLIRWIFESIEENN